MQVRFQHPKSLSQHEIDIWRQMVAADDRFSSPYFRPEFILDVAAVRNDVETAVIMDGDEIVGFFPFQRCGRVAKPVAGMLSDVHGIIHNASYQWTWPEVLTACKLAAWDYHYLIEHQIPDGSWHPDVAPAAIMNLTDGFDAYAARLESASVIRQTDRKARKLVREHGPLRFEWNTDDENAFEHLLKWKSQQYRDSDIADVFSFPWTTELLTRLWKRTSPDCQGVLSVLYVKDQPAAVHFGLRSGKVLHQWFPAYDPSLQSYSAGMIHLLEMARAAARHNVERIDLGRMCHYKSRVATDSVNVAEGSVDLRPVSRMVRSGYHQTYEWLRQSRLRSVARIPGRLLRKLAEQRRFQ